MTKSSIFTNKKRIKISVILIIVAVILGGPAVTGSEVELSRDEILDQQAESDEVKSIEQQLERFTDSGIDEIIKGYNPQSILSDVAKGNFEFSITGILNGIVNYLFKEIYQNIHILTMLIALVILCAILKNLQTSFLSESVGEMAFYVCYIVIVTVMTLSFSSVLTMGMGIINSMVDFMYATIPVLITLLVSGGNITSGGIFQPVLIVIVEVAATIMKNVFIPLIFLSTVLTIVNNISDKVQISKLAGFLKQITGWALGFMLTAFIAIISLQGSLGAVIDGVTSKTAKFAIGAFIPVVGGYLADAADTVIGCTLLIKNAAGVAAMIGIVVICLIPLLKILALIALYRITAVLIEPVAEKRITSCISSIAGSMTYIFGIVAAVAFMFLLSLTVIIGASNLSAMVR